MNKNDNIMSSLNNFYDIIKYKFRKSKKTSFSLLTFSEFIFYEYIFSFF